MASESLAATSGTATVSLAALATASVSVLTPTLALAPTATDYDNGFVEATGASGLQIQVRSNSSTGMALLVRCQDATPQIALADLLVRTTTAAGTGGTALAAYTAVLSTNQTLWSTGTAQSALKTIATDVRIQNPFSYVDAAAAGTTTYSNTLTYAVIVL
jgi:hypothetical protein